MLESVFATKKEFKTTVIYMTNHRHTTFQKSLSEFFSQCAGDGKNKDRDSRKISREGCEVGWREAEAFRIEEQN